MHAVEGAVTKCRLGYSKCVFHSCCNKMVLVMEGTVIGLRVSLFRRGGTLRALWNALTMHRSTKPPPREQSITL